ncbi:MAG: hypothetical protein Q9176_002421 [Flavoplaca citrina]
MKDSLNQPKDVKSQSLENALEYSTIHNQAPIVRTFAKSQARKLHISSKVRPSRPNSTATPSILRSALDLAIPVIVIESKFVSVATCIDLPLATACSSTTHDIARHPLAPTATVDSDGGVTATDAVDLELTAVAFAVEVELPIGCGDACEEEGGEKDEGTHFGYGGLASRSCLNVIVDLVRAIYLGDWMRFL